MRQGRGWEPLSSGSRGPSYLHEQVDEEAAQCPEGALQGLQLPPGGGEVEAGEEHVHALCLDPGLLAQPQLPQAGRPPWRGKPARPTGITLRTSKSSRPSSRTRDRNLCPR